MNINRNYLKNGIYLINYDTRVDIKINMPKKITCANIKKISFNFLFKCQGLNFECKIIKETINPLLLIQLISIPWPMKNHIIRIPT